MIELVIGIMAVLVILILTYVFGQIVNLMMDGWFFVLIAGLVLGMCWLIGFAITGGYITGG